MGGGVVCWTPAMWERQRLGLNSEPPPEERARRDRIAVVLRLLRKLGKMPATNIDLKDAMHAKLVAERDALHAKRPGPPWTYTRGREA